MTPQEFEAVLQTLDFLEDEINALKSRVDELESENRYLQTDVEDLNDRLYGIEGKSL